MKVLWLCNVIIPQVCQVLDLPVGNFGGWLNQLADCMDQSDDIELCLCAPYMQAKELTYVPWGKNSSFFGYQKKVTAPHKYDPSLEGTFIDVLRKFEPDVIHIFGTEFPHTLAMVRAFHKPEKTVIHIQGLVSFCSLYYCTFLPEKIVHRWTFRDLLRHDNIACQKRKFEKRGNFEKEAICHVSHVMGRTDWDRACTALINPQVQYHKVQEMMRSPFYEGQWKLKNCEQYSIFISQGGYPIKGLHLALEALAMLKQWYSDVKLYVAGSDIIHYNTFKDKLRKTYYSKYIQDRIKELDLENQIIFTGPLSAEKMKQRYLSSHVFVSPSVIENSPNSVGEAMLLGVPIVASDVGGVSSLIQHRRNGYLYQAGAPYMLAYYVGQVFENELMTEQMSAEAQKCAAEIYDRDRITRQLRETYRSMFELK